MTSHAKKVSLGLITVALLCAVVLLACGGPQARGASTEQGAASEGGAPSAFDAPPAPGTRARCPVNGSEFVVTAQTPIVEHGGRHYVLCCEGCRPAFEANPPAGADGGS